MVKVDLLISDCPAASSRDCYFSGLLKNKYVEQVRCFAYTSAETNHCLRPPQAGVATYSVLALWMSVSESFSFISEQTTFAIDYQAEQNFRSECLRMKHDRLRHCKNLRARDFLASTN